MPTLHEDKKWYLRAPSLGYPEDGPIRIGNIITNIAEPENEIANLGGELKVIPGVSYGQGKKEREVHSSAAIKLATKLYTVFGGQADGQRSKDWETTYNFDRIDSLMLARNPRVEEIQELRGKNKAVRDALTRGPVYIITALKLAKGLRYANVQAKEKKGGIGGNTQITHEATLDARLEGSKSGRVTEKYTLMGNVILAYKLQIVRKAGWKWRGEANLETGNLDPGRAGFMSKEGDVPKEALESAVLSLQDVGFIAQEEEYESIQDHDIEDEEEEWRMTCIEA
ncbi:unnamed protein product [Alternaria sp. RS040]